MPVLHRFVGYRFALPASSGVGVFFTKYFISTFRYCWLYFLLGFRVLGVRVWGSGLGRTGGVNALGTIISQGTIIWLIEGDAGSLDCI